MSKEVVPNDTGVGAPTKYTPTIVRKLEAAFNNGFNITEACDYAGISRFTYYEWLSLYPLFSNKMEQSRQMPNRKAKEILINTMQNAEADPIGARLTAMYWLDRRDPEFKAKSEVDNTHALVETREKIKDFLDDTSTLDDKRTEPAPADSDAGSTDVAQATPDIS